MMQAQMGALTSLTDRVIALERGSSGDAGGSSGRSRAPARWVGRDRTDDLCYYHANFDKAARSCGNTASGRPCKMINVPLAPPTNAQNRGRSRSRGPSRVSSPPPPAVNAVRPEDQPIYTKGDWGQM